MTILLTIVLFLLIFSLLILIHELGHFTAAKRAGVKVEEFGMGLPPRLFGIKKGETIYSINWIPFGGFVRMLGEDTTSKEARSSERSFVNQPLRKQAWIVVAGVVMNLLLAWSCLTVGFWLGIEPLISTQEDFYESIYDGSALIEPGITVVDSHSAQLVSGDEFLVHSIEDWDALTAEIQAGDTVSVRVRHEDGTTQELGLDAALLEEVELAPFYLPRLIYMDRGAEGGLFSGLLQDGDFILSVDGEPILSEEDLFTHLRGEPSIVLEVYRPELGVQTFPLALPESLPLITYIEPSSPAGQVGLQLGDQIKSVNGQTFYSSTELVESTPGFAEQGRLHYEVLRNGEILGFDIQPNEMGKVGIGLSDFIPDYGDLSLYLGYAPSTLVGFQELHYGLSAPWVALKEMLRLGKSTALMFGTVLQQFLSGHGVPEGVAGPVGIAQMTFLTVQDGFAAVLRFVALLSLSLGVINILPIPALDGGKFFFILVQALTGKKMNAKYEYLIHAAGFFFLLLLIAVITFHDVMQLFS